MNDLEVQERQLWKLAIANRLFEDADRFMKHYKMSDFFWNEKKINQIYFQWKNVSYF